MNICKKLLSYILAAAMLLTLAPAAFASEAAQYSITNGYLTYTFNADTGGFAIETAEGNPKKVLDNDIPLLYAEDKTHSNGTSFITVRVGDKDYIFGQDYGFFGIDSKLGTPAVSAEGRLLTIPWTIKGITVTLKAALGQDADSDITGNVGLSFEVKNESGRDENVSVRLLLDTALGNEIDAPYFVVDTDIKPTMTESEYAGDELPQQIRCVDSLSKPSKLSYILTKGWNGGVTADRAVIGHWANMANTRYDYKPDRYCDFTNYSNDHRMPDSAAALYWENKALANGESFCGELLYGVGNFSKNADGNVGINITAGRVELADDKKSYKNDGIIDVTVEIDNTVDGAVHLTNAMIRLTVDEKEFSVIEGDAAAVHKEIGSEIVTKQYKLKAVPQAELTAGTIYVSLTATQTLADGTEADFESAAERSVILRSTEGKLPDVQMNKINPKIVYTSGEKAVTVSGKMKAFKALKENQGWDLRLIHETTGESVLIKKSNISFLDDSYENMSFSTGEELTVGNYKLVFEFTNPQLVAELGKSITCPQKLQVSADPKYKLKMYGTMALIRTTDNNKTDYDFYAFENEGDYLSFYKGSTEKTGLLHGGKIKYNFGEEKAIGKHEILLTIRANLREMTRKSGENTETYWQASYSDGDIIINNMLSYEGEKPLELFEQNGEYTVKGDGLIKVVNSINVWRSKWSFSVNKGMVTSLDGERLEKKGEYTLGSKPLQLSLDGAATMIQSVGGFLVDLKFGEMSSKWHDGGDGIVTYGIGFGGSISIPISAKKKDNKATDLTADQEDMSEELNNLFDESLTADQEDMSLEMNDLFDETPKKTSSGAKLTKDTNLSEGQLSAEINNILFGEKGDVENGAVKVDSTGFIGIDAKTTLALPKDVLGSLVANSPGIYASVTINTIENIYQLDVGVNIKVIECEGTLAFKEVKVKGKDKILPDKIEFYVRNGLKIPLAPPVLYMTGLGGGINELADTIGGQFDSLPPITILLFTRLEAIETLIGDFNARVSLEGMSLTGDMKLKFSDKLLDLNAGIYAKWIEPWELNLYGNVSIIDGLIKGGITINIADHYFYGYIFASICIPDSIPFVGGKELAGVEAAVSHEFIGANIKIIGIRFGVIYYWGDGVSFGKNIDLSAPKKGDGTQNAMMSLESGDMIGCYGTNIHQLAATPVLTNGGISLLSAERSASINVSNAAGSDALLIEIPFTGTGTPAPGEITLKTPSGKTVQTVGDDGSGGGNMLVQEREDGNFIYVTVTEADKIENGIWTVTYTTENISIGTFMMNRVDDIAEITSCTAAHASETDYNIDASWSINGGAEQSGTIDVYLTEDKDILSKIKTSANKGDSLGTNILHKDYDKISSGSEKITLPKTMPSGTYYVVTTLSTSEGISLAMAASPVKFKNPELPKPVKGAHINYGGNGNLFVKVEDADSPDYTHYIAEIVANDGTVLQNNIGQFEQGKNFVFGKEAGLEVGKTYHVNIRTLNEKYEKLGEEYKTVYYYGDDTVSSDLFTLEEKHTVMPKLESVKASFDTSKEYISQNSVTVEYTFSEPVFVELSINGGQKAYSGGQFKKDWKFTLDGLEDGDYIIDFTAYTETKNHITGSDSELADAQLGFTVDTSAPVLSLGRKTADSVEQDGSGAVKAIFGANTVLTDENGNYTIEGLTEKSVSFTVDGAETGIARGANGSFVYTGKLADGESYKQHTLCAVDNAENKSETVVSVIRKGAFSLKEIEIRNGDNEIPQSNGEKKLSVRNGHTAALTAWAVTDDGKRIRLENDAVLWNVLYGKNNVSVSDGTLTALAIGETAVKVKLKTADIELSGGDVASGGLSDYAIVEIGQNSKNDLADKISEAENVLASNPSASEDKKQALSDAINAAKELLNNPSATEEDYTNGVTALDNAISVFNRTDSRRGSSGGRAAAYAVNVLPSEHGKVSVSSSRAYSGSSVTITAVPDAGYAVEDILINGKSVGRAEIYTVQSISEDLNIQVIFGEKSDLPFTDVLKTDWFGEYVKYVYDNGLFNGVSDALFAPNTEITRAMMVTVLHRADGTPEAAASSFEDVQADAYYAKAVAWAQKNNIVLGISNEQFAPDQNITREQIAAIIYRYARYKGQDVSAAEKTDITSYADYSEASDYAIGALAYMVGSGIMKGRTDSTLNPKDYATRAEISAVMQRFLSK